jgi:hypothetical protein
MDIAHTTPELLDLLLARGGNGINSAGIAQTLEGVNPHAVAGFIALEVEAAAALRVLDDRPGDPLPRFSHWLRDAAATADRQRVEDAIAQKRAEAIAAWLG